LLRALLCTKNYFYNDLLLLLELVVLRALFSVAYIPANREKWNSMILSYLFGWFFSIFNCRFRKGGEVLWLYCRNYSGISSDDMQEGSYGIDLKNMNNNKSREHGYFVSHYGSAVFHRKYCLS
jgi:hypothetical protein